MYCAVRRQFKRIFFSKPGFSFLNEKGAAGVLPLMFSTFGGAAFLFTFYNLSQYTSARSAADQAARRAARCLTPSDGECVDQNANGLNNPSASQNWFGYRPGTGPTTVQYDTYSYSAQVYATSYSASYSSFDVLTGNPIILHQETEVKPQRFFGLLNSYQKLRADLQILVSKNNVVKRCVIKEGIELPNGLEMDFEDTRTYFDDRWCPKTASPLVAAAAAPGCADVVDGSWSLVRDGSNNFSPCGVALPDPRVAGESSFTLLGGDPVCDGEPEAPFSDIPRTLDEANKGFQAVYGTPKTLPGDKGRAFPVVAERQFVVVEVYSCNPDGFKSALQANIKNKNDLKKYFTAYDKFDVPENANNPDFNGQGGQSSFVYNRAQGVSFMAKEDWTYFEWNRQANGERHLERKVCRWLTYDEAKATYPEFSNGKTNQYQSGQNFGQSIQTIKVYDAPSCLPREKKEVSFNCPNKTVFGQPGSFNDCLGWADKQRETEELYRKNAEQAILLNQNPAWGKFENLKTDFTWKFEPKYSPNYGGQAWEFSWTSDAFNGKQVVNPNAIRAHNGYNPKELPQGKYIDAYERTDGKVDPTLFERLRQAISEAEGHPVDPNYVFQHAPSGTSKPVEITGIWPFIKDDNGKPVSTARPYINPSVNGQGFDYDLNCTQDDICQNNNNYNSIEEYLRSVSSSSISGTNLSDPAYRFTYQETLVGPQYLDLVSAQGLPACTQFRTLCGNNVADGPAISLGSSNVMPQSCQNGTYLNCYSEYSGSQVSTQKYDPIVREDLAKNKALAEVRRLNPAAKLCDNLTQSNCVLVNIQTAGTETKVDVQFSAPLTTPFTEILSQDTLVVGGTKREIIETQRLN